MNLVLGISAAEASAHIPSAAFINTARKEMFLDFCAALESHGIRYAILAGYQGYPERIDSDVDFMVSEADFSRLTTLLNDPDNVAGAQLVQMLRHETSACYYVLAKQVGEHIAYLHPDAAAAYRRSGRLWLRSETVLATRRKSPAGFWTPAAAVEFEYYFVKRVDKGLVEYRHLDALAALMAEDAGGCLASLQRLLVPGLQVDVSCAIASRDSSWFSEHSRDLKAALQQSLTRESIKDRMRNRLAEMLRKARRILQPTGLVIAVLGPDGSGKTTIIEHLERELAPAFRRVHRFHLRPHFGAARNSTVISDPHGQPSRSRVTSVLKVGMFLFDYWLGWLRLVLPAKVRSTLVIFDRYYHDMLVDSARYRLPKGFLGTRLMAPLVPQPDVWLILTAQPELLVARKGEISLETARKLTVAYEALTAQLPNAVKVDTGQPLHCTLADAVAPILETMVRRATRGSKSS